MIQVACHEICMTTTTRTMQLYFCKQQHATKIVNNIVITRTPELTFKLEWFPERKLWLMKLVLYIILRISWAQTKYFSTDTKVQRGHKYFTGGFSDFLLNLKRRTNAVIANVCC